MVESVKASGSSIAVITGGEPLMHDLSPLTTSLQHAGIKTHIETSGAHPLSGQWDWICLSPKKFKAPLEEPANPTWAPNPAKAPWYFLGLQEMLVYFDPWMAGVVLPVLIIVGLVAIPYIDTNPKGNGYYTIMERKMAIWLFMFGWLVLWVYLIIKGVS